MLDIEVGENGFNTDQFMTNGEWTLVCEFIIYESNNVRFREILYQI